jgi:hypothetical protein
VDTCKLSLGVQYVNHEEFARLAPAMTDLRHWPEGSGCGEFCTGLLTIGNLAITVYAKGRPGIPFEEK